MSKRSRKPPPRRRSEYLKDVNLDGERKFWDAAEQADAKFQAALLAAGARPGVNTTPSTDCVRTPTPITVRPLQSSAGDL